MAVVRLRAMLVLMVAVGAGFGLERLVVVDHRQAELCNHAVQDVVGEVTHPARADLECDVAVAQVIRHQREAPQVAAPDRRDGLARGDDLEHRAVGGAQPVAAAQHRAARQLDADLEARRDPRALACSSGAARTAARAVRRSAAEVPRPPARACTPAGAP